MVIQKSTWKDVCVRVIPLVVLLAVAGCGTGNGNNNGVPIGTGATVTITGHLQYEDRTYDENGFTGATPTKPIRFATVQVVRSSDAAVLNSSSDASDADGNYTVTFTNTGTAGVYVRVLAGAPAWQIQIRQPPAFLWAIISDLIDDSGAASFTMDLTAGLDSGGGVFNLLDVMTSGAEFVNALAGALPPLTVNWSPGSCDGTYFIPADNSIFVLGGCSDGDTDEYDDPVLLHEFGHFAGSVYSRDDSPGGQHSLNDSTQDIRLSWSEGWGDFFSSAVRNDPLYVDTVGTTSTASANLSFNLEDFGAAIPGLGTDAVYSTNEISVAAVLWDIFDDTPAEALTNAGGVDLLSAGMSPIWDVTANYLPALTCTRCVSFEDFWDGWFARGQGFQAEMDIVVADRKMALAADGFESDDTAATAALITVNGASQTHTLYPADNADHIRFTASSAAEHTVETLALTNGADTFIEIYDSPTAAMPIAMNDNWDNQTYGVCGVNPITQQSNCPPNGIVSSTGREPLSSRVRFTTNNGTTYYIRVSRSTAAPPSAGVYGSYDLKITSP